MMSLRIGLWIIMLATGPGGTWNNLIQGYDIHPDDPECNLRDNILSCDYKDSGKDSLHLRPLEPSIQRVFLSNIGCLQLCENTCANISLSDVGNAVVEKCDSECNDPFEMSLKRTQLDMIPLYVKDLYMEESTVDRMEVNSSLSKLHVLYSKIKHLKISTSLAPGKTAFFYASKIGYLQKFIVDATSSLMLHESTVESIAENALVIEGGKLTLRDSLLELPTSSVEVSSGSSVTVMNYTGKLIVESKYKPAVECISQWTTTPEQLVRSCEHPKVFIVLFVFCLILLLFSWSGFAIYLFKEDVLEMIPFGSKRNVGKSKRGNVDHEKLSFTDILDENERKGKRDEEGVKLINEEEEDMAAREEEEKKEKALREEEEKKEKALREEEEKKEKALREEEEKKEKALREEEREKEKLAREKEEENRGRILKCKEKLINARKDRDQTNKRYTQLIDTKKLEKEELDETRRKITCNLNCFNYMLQHLDELLRIEESLLYIMYDEHNVNTDPYKVIRLSQNQYNNAKDKITEYFRAFVALKEKEKKKLSEEYKLLIVEVVSDLVIEMQKPHLEAKQSHLDRLDKLAEVILKMNESKNG